VKRILILFSLLILMIVGCQSDSTKEVWYVVSDRYATMIIANDRQEYMFFAYMDISTLRSYRGVLLKEGITSDDLGALQSLFGYEGNHFIQAKDVELYSDPSLSFKERIKYLTGGEGDLSKRVKVDTLQTLGVGETTVDDIVDLHLLSQEQKTIYRFYDVGLFLQKNGTPSLMQRNMHEWSKRAIEEIEREEL